jgi:hypothetical protein
MNSQLLRMCLCAMALACAGGAGAADAVNGAAPNQSRAAGGEHGAPYIEQVGADCVLVNVYLQQNDGVAEQVVLREPVECAGQGDDLAVADLSR